MFRILILSFALDVNPNATTLHHLKVAIEQRHGTPFLNQCLFLSQPSYSNTPTPLAIIVLGLSTDDTISSTSCAVKEEGNEAEEELEKETKEEDKEAEEECRQ